MSAIDDGMNVIALALDAARGERLAVGLLVLDALAPPAGAALSTLISIQPGTLGLLLATFGGAFSSSAGACKSESLRAKSHDSLLDLPGFS